MSDNKFSPEERLFRVIQEQKTPSSGMKNTGIMMPRMSLGKIKVFLSGFMPKARIGSDGQTVASISLPIRLHEIDPKTVNMILAAILTILVACAVYYAIDQKPKISKITEGISMAALSETPKNTAGEELEPIDSYVSMARKRDIFRPMPEKEQKAVQVESVQSGAEELKTLAGSLKLKGISWGESPKAMIKHEGEGKVYFLKPGQTIGSTGISVKEIFKNSVVIRHDGDEMELL
ncbi:MAG: hypothetical protein ISS92_05660 [Candidatus Omnitrophica bacterium]|nr:hypothetical protein [Candidatus Omnitrophota bacterium]